MPIVFRRHITPDDLRQNWRFDDFEAHWIFTELAPSARRISATPPKPPLRPQGCHGSILIVAKGIYNCPWTQLNERSTWRALGRVFQDHGERSNIFPSAHQ